jgi:adenylyltransferase/sulfurtransferase
VTDTVPFEITVEELKKMQDEGSPLQLIDCREQDEYALVNLGGTLIPMRETPQHLEEFSHDTPLIIMCRTGSRSAMVTQYLRQNGFANAQNLKGGIYAWSDKIDPRVKKY